MKTDTPTPAIATPTLSWLVDELIDFMESCTNRNRFDLKLTALRASALTRRSDEWLNTEKDRRWPTTLELIGARVAGRAISEILVQPNRRLKRTRQLVPLESLRAQDARCLMWLARRPGRNLAEKLTRDRRLLGVVRELSLDVPENRVTRSTAHLIDQLLTLRESHDPRIKQAQGSSRRFLTFAEEHGIAPVTYSFRPNNALLKDRNYRRIWLSYRWLSSIADFRKGVGDQLPRCIAEAITLMIASIAQRLGYELADTGIPCVSRPSAHNAWIQNLETHWFRVENGSLRLLSVSLNGHDGVVGTSIKLKTIQRRDGGKLDIRSCEAHLHPKHLDHQSFSLESKGIPEAREFSICGPTKGLHSAHESLNSAVAQMLGPAPKRAHINLPHDSPQSPILRFSADGIRLAGQLIEPFGGLIDSGPHDNGEQVSVFGREARNRIILGLQKRCGTHWITPGRVTGTLAAPKSRRSELRELLIGQEDDACDPPVIQSVAIPAGLPFGYENILKSSLPASGQDRWLVPQCVAAAIDARWNTADPFEPDLEEFVAVFDSDGERCDASVLQWTNIETPLSGRDVGWLHFREVIDPIQYGPSALDLKWQIILDVFRQGDLPASEQRAACMQAIHQVSLEQLLELPFHPDERLELWTGMLSDPPLLHEIQGEHVSNAARKWMHNVVLPWLDKRMRFWSEHGRSPDRLLLNGRIYRLPEVRDQINEWAEQQGITNVRFLVQDRVESGLATFLDRQNAGMATWCEHLPVLELQSRDDKNRITWLKLFDEEAHVTPGGSLLLGPVFSFECTRSPFSVPMRCDGQRNTSDPCVDLLDHCDPPVALFVQARYDVGRSGLTMVVRSQEPGLLPETSMKWGEKAALVHVQQELFVDNEPISLLAFEKQARRLGVAMTAYFERNGGQDQLQKAIDECARFLGGTLRSSEPLVWRDVNPELIAEFAGKLGWMHCSKAGRDHTSTAFPGGLRWRCNLVSPKARKQQQRCLVSDPLQESLTRCLGKLRAACPDHFLRWVLDQGIHDPRDNIRHESIRTLGRVCCPASSRVMDGIRNAIELAMTNSDDSTSYHSPVDRSAWYWCLHAALSSSEDSVIPFGLERIEKILQSLIENVADFLRSPEHLTTSAWRDYLAALLATRHATRLDGGMDSLGPGSELATDLVSKLKEAAEITATYWSERQFQEITILGFLDDAPLFQSSHPILQVAECWAGKVTTLLRQTNDD